MKSGVSFRQIWEEPLMIWGGGGSGKSGKKKLNGYSPRKKKTQLPVGQEKQLNGNSLPEGPPRSLIVRPYIENGWSNQPGLQR